MLIITRRIGESFRIGDSIRVTLLQTQSRLARVRIDGPKGTAVHRTCINLPMDSRVHLWGSVHLALVRASQHDARIGVEADDSLKILRSEIANQPDPTRFVSIADIIPPGSFGFRVTEESGQHVKSVRIGDCVVCRPMPVADGDIAVVEDTAGRKLLRQVKVSGADITDLMGQAVRPIGRVISLLRSYDLPAARVTGGAQ